MLNIQIMNNFMIACVLLNISKNNSGLKGLFSLPVFLFFILEKVHYMNIHPITLFVCSVKSRIKYYT